MARTKPFFRHVQHVTGIMARAPESERYPYHDQSECPIGRQVKKSGDWQYYLARPGEERNCCARCAELAEQEATNLQTKEPHTPQAKAAPTRGIFTI